MSVLAESFIDRVAGIITRYSMLERGDRAGVAVSGGADSMALLELLHRLSAPLGTELLVVHVNHALRGAESEGDEEFVRARAAALDLEVAVARAPIESGNLEQEARRLRREFFQECMAKRGLRRVALGHTRSDQAETVLFRLLRGSGLAGLAGMRPVTEDGLIRPLLTSSREEVRAWARAEGIVWREDSSNTSRQFARNRLRNETMPLLAREFNANLEAVLAGVAQLARDEENYWAQQIEPLYQEIAKRNELGSILQVERLSALHPAVQRRLIRRALQEAKGDLRSLDFAHVEAVLRICHSEHGHDRVIVPGVDALRSFDQLLLARPGALNSEPRNFRVDLQPGVEHPLPASESSSIFVNWAEYAGENYVTFKEDQTLVTEVADLDGDALARQGEPIHLFARNWEPGDELRRPGHKGADKIKSLFQANRVLLWERRHWPVVVAGGEIVWTRGFGVSASYASSAGSRRVLRLEYRRRPD
jgi:tRNA(Ile)-lysidine synthase